VAYFLIGFVDQQLGSKLLGGLLGGADVPPERIAAANVLMRRIGLCLFAATAALAWPAASLTSLDGLAACLLAVGVCSYIYAARTTSVVLLERRLEYRWIVAAEVLDQLSFYAVAIPLVATGAGIRGVAVAFAIRGILPALLLWRVSPARAARRVKVEPSERKRLLAYTVPALGAAAFGLVEGLVPTIVLGGGHARELAFVMTTSALVGYAAVIQIVTQRMAFPSFALAARDADRLQAIVGRANSATTFMVVSTVVPVAALGPLWLPALFGPDWEAAAPALAWLGFGYICLTSMGTLTGALYSLGHPRDVFLLMAVLTVGYGALGLVLAQDSILLAVPIAYALTRVAGMVLTAGVLRARGLRTGFAQPACIAVAGGATAVLLQEAVAASDWAAVAALSAAAGLGWALLLRANAPWLRQAIGAVRARPGAVTSNG
jgi:O-antigen/teichoic acid export membrane protein